MDKLMEYFGITRRESLKSAAGLAANATLLKAGPARAQDDPLSGAALYRLVEAYGGMGEHRTGTAADNITSVWLAKELEHAGLKASLQQFALKLFTPQICGVQAGAERFDAFPAWPPHVTGPDGVEGELVSAGASDLSGKIVVWDCRARISATWAIPGTGDAVQKLIAGGARAVIATTEGFTGEIIAQNAEPADLVWGAPVVLVGGKDFPALSELAQRQVRARVRLTGSFVDAHASNVVASRPGKGKCVVISTPKSGWFRCAGERGTGIAILLALAQTLAQETDYPLVFTANAGHELAETGAAGFLEQHAPTPADTRLWLHIGANVGMQQIAFNGFTPQSTGEASPARRIAASEVLLPVAKETFAELVGYRDAVEVSPAYAPGELGRYLRAGYGRLAGLIGSSPVFHTRMDTADLATTPAILESVARATLNFVRMAAEKA
jgi:hypothetical protein